MFGGNLNKAQLMLAMTLDLLQGRAGQPQLVAKRVPPERQQRSPQTQKFLMWRAEEKRKRKNQKRLEDFESTAFWRHPLAKKEPSTSS